MNNYLIGVDLGTNGLKVALIDLKGNVVCESYEETTITSKKVGLMEQDPNHFYRGTLKGISKVVEEAGVDSGSVLAVGIDGQMGGIVGIDAKYNPVTHYDSVLDTRSQEYSALLKKRFEEIIFQYSSGSWSHAAKILWWKHEMDGTYKRICKFITIAPYVAGKMVGLKGDEAYIDFTSLFCSGMCEIKKLTWSHKICKLLRIDTDKLPIIVEPWRVIGKIDTKNSALCGLKEGTPVVAGAGDQPAGFLGAGIIKPGMAIDVAGSTSVFSVCADDVIPDSLNKRICYMNAVIPDLYYALTFVNGGGIALRWFRDQFTPRQIQKAEEKGKNLYALLDDEIVSLEPGSGSLIFIPHLGGRACPNEPEIRGAWIGLNWGHKGLHLYKAILESIAYDHACTLKLFTRQFPSIKVESVRVTGGGAKSTVWNQIKADVLNIPYVRLERDGFAILGSSLIAGYGVGVFQDLKKTAQAIVQEAGMIYPDNKKHVQYQRFVNDYETAITQLKPVFCSLSMGTRTRS